MVGGSSPGDRFVQWQGENQKRTRFLRTLPHTRTKRFLRFVAPVVFIGAALASIFHAYPVVVGLFLLLVGLSVTSFVQDRRKLKQRA
jgi:hypothetical protein